MRLTRLSLVVPFLAAACGQSLQPLQPFDAGAVVDDLAKVHGGGGDGGSPDLAGGDLAGTTPDTDGPVIAYVNPLVGTFVGGMLDIIVTVTDPSGVNPSTVQVVLANDPTKYTIPLHKTGTTDTYHGLFDVGSLGKGYVFLDLSVRADDTRGNHAQLGEEVLVDNTPPWMSMNAAVQMRVSKLDGMLDDCSHLFSPLGPTVVDPVNGPEVAFEGATMKQIMGLRARIEDHGNLAPGQRVEYFSDIDESTVTLFAVGSTPGLPVLAVDTDGDGICDDVNPTLIPTAGMVVMANQALALAMSPLTDSGSADYTPSSGSSAACGEFGTATAVPPDLLCKKGGTGLTFVIPGFGKDKPIYSLPPIRDPDACVGFPLDAANHLPEGPACVLTRAIDNAGNHMVSFPLHICIDLGNHVCDTFVPDPTACTGKLDAAGMVIAGSTCTEPPVGGNPGTFVQDGSEVRNLTFF